METEIRKRDAELLAVLDRDFGKAASRAGDWLRCAPGCGDCCFGPFPVTRLDAWRLCRGLEELERSDPDRRRQVAARADRAVRQLAPGFPGDVATGRLEASEAVLDRYFEGHGKLPCPALDPRNGRCELHAWRPVSCRIYGPPAEFGDRKSPPCGLCFRGAPASVVEGCRMTPDRDGREASMLREMGVPPGEDWETLIAFVLADGG